MRRKTKLDFNDHHSVVIYARVSSEKQNERSVPQQIEQIESTVRKLGYPWQVVKVYQDDGVSGRRVRSRPGFTKLVADVQSGKLKVSFILVDTAERFGRADEVDTIRQRLSKRCGVAVLTANSNFTDPTTSNGRVMEFMENYRATEEGKVKAYQVRRGKRDAASQKQWPGGKAPLGYILTDKDATARRGKRNKPQTLVPDPSTAPIVVEIYRLADENHWGAEKITKFLNSDAGTGFRLTSSRVRYILRSEIYLGILIHGRIETEFNDDRRICYQADDSEVLRVEGFCEPLISREQWDRVQLQFEERRRQLQARKGDRDDNQEPLGNSRRFARGISIKYPLSGLVFCDHCHRRMNINGGKYSRTDGQTSLYNAYGCAGRHDGTCSNTDLIPEAWLRKQVVDSLLEKLDLSADPGAIRDLLRMIERRLDELSSVEPEMEARLKKEMVAIESTVAGLGASIGSPSLTPLARQQLETQLNEAVARRAQIDQQRAAIDCLKKRSEKVIDSESIRERISSIHRIIGETRFEAWNAILSQHIDSIVCSKGRRVVVRLCKLGLHPEAASEIMRLADGAKQVVDSVESESRTVRRRARLDDSNLEPSDFGGEDIDDVLYHISDPKRFQGLDPEWFWELDFVVPKRLEWYEENAERVFVRRLHGKLTYEALEAEFGKTKPTLVRAIKHYIATHPESEGLLSKRPSTRKPRVDIEAFSADAYQRWNNGESTLSLSAVYGCSPPTVEKAIRMEFSKRGEKMPSQREMIEAKSAQAKALLDGGASLAEISKIMQHSECSVRKYLARAYKKIGQVMPDFRRREHRDQRRAAG